MRKGFTLIELLVSIAMVLILILGVNAIFKMASDTVNAGNALAAADRENRSATAVLYDDVRTASITDGPMLLIRSETVAAFRNRDDEQSDRDGNPLTTDLDGNNKEGETGVKGEAVGPFTYTTRNHRIDRVGFFSNQFQKRQTGTHSDQVCRFVDTMASAESLVWIGHVDQPAKVTSGIPYASPGVVPTAARSNPSNLYATDWILGRNVILLNPGLTPSPGDPPRPDRPIYLKRMSAQASADRLSPLEPVSQDDRADANAVRWSLQSSRYDLAETAISEFRDRLVFDIGLNGTTGTVAGGKRAWWEILAGSPASPDSTRFQCNPFPAKPLTPAMAAQTTPIFVRGCTQFVVEYAGDYLKQNADGSVAGTYLDRPAGTDGQVDFSIVLERPEPNGPINQVRRTRWYGMPRNVDTFDDTIAGPVITGGLTTNLNLMRDVVPLRDVLLAAGAGPKIPADFFEHFVNLEPQANYGQVRTGAQGYWAAWGPGDLASGKLPRPKMLRITMTVDDPNGRMTAGQTYEYVIALP